MPTAAAPSVGGFSLAGCFGCPPTRRCTARTRTLAVAVAVASQRWRSAVPGPLRRHGAVRRAAAAGVGSLRPDSGQQQEAMGGDRSNEGCCDGDVDSSSGGRLLSGSRVSKSPNSQYLRRPDIQRPDIHSGAGVGDWAGGFWAAWRRCIVNAVHLPHATSEAMRRCSDVVSALSSVTADDGGKAAAQG